MSFNKITIFGNLGKDPELRYTPQGNAVCNFSVATTEKKQGEPITTWFRATLWGKLAENASKFLTKGSPVYLEGRLTLPEYKNRDGEKQTTAEVNVTDMQFIGGKSDGENFREREAAESRAENVKSETPGLDRTGWKPSDDDIPFVLLFGIIGLSYWALSVLQMSV